MIASLVVDILKGELIGFAKQHQASGIRHQASDIRHQTSENGNKNIYTYI